MKRRKFLRILGGSALGTMPTALPLWLHAQPVRLARIGFLRVGPPPAAFIDGFRQGMREHGLVENQHFAIEYSLAQVAVQIPHAAAELVRRRVDIILASGTPSVVPAKDAAGQIPVVFVATLDPVATGLVASLARPGGNVTGMTSISGDLIAKRLQLTKELLPDLKKIAVLVRESSPTTAQYVQESRAAASSLGIELQIVTERSPNELDEIFAEIQGVDALVVADDAEFTSQRGRIAELGLRNKLPIVSGLRELVDAGCLVAYGANFGELYRRAASQVNKILKGVSPANVPVEQPIAFELVVNLRSAKALGLQVPGTLLGRADEVVE
jgi:putative tryptophan/tyrosine transport system substrate-binding protein